MIIIGLDPGLARTGFGIIDSTRQNSLVRCGCLTTRALDPLPDRLSELAADLTAILVHHRPSLAVVEQIFFGSNKKTAIITAQARGVILHALQKHHVTISELTPLQIKSRLTGHGRATKQQVQSLIKTHLSLDSFPSSHDDAADALAAALCGADLPINLKPSSLHD